MIKKTFEKKKAIVLRRKGKTYSEILSVVPVAKSTLALWLHDVHLAQYQYQRITEKKLLSAERGGVAKREARITKSEQILNSAILDIGTLSKRELFLIGTALYWAEGSKQKEHNVSQPMVFGNSDPNMIQFFLYWLETLGIKKNDIRYSLYIHTSGDYKRAVHFWSQVVQQPVSVFEKRVYFKKGNPKTERKNVGEKYYGLLRVTIKKSTDLNRKISGWVRGIGENCA